MAAGFRSLLAFFIGGAATTPPAPVTGGTIAAFQLRADCSAFGLATEKGAMQIGNDAGGMSLESRT